ncbi:MAG: SUMF1/EgtB/PvdO family nonheme iron enzyme [Magnetococcales bacterium]|nr:SUMF1/EgtB/PvdO family nonheme iron enzyme [Magnetococcales bacterium]
MSTQPEGDATLGTDSGFDALRRTLSRGDLPLWASGWGRDRYGVFITFTVDGPRPDPSSETPLNPELYQVTQKLRWIPSGSFLMGSPKDEPKRSGVEGPQHEVVFKQGFWIFDTACTQALWKAVTGNNPSSFKGADRPVENVNWYDAQVFITTLNGMLPGLNLSLPSEAQWEYACRAGTTTPFSFGEMVDPDQINYDGKYPYLRNSKDRYREQTVPVASLPANPWGLHEMHGNVWEWCEDPWHEDYDGVPQDGSVWHDKQLTILDIERVVRGGSWYSPAFAVRSSCRDGSEPDVRTKLGFRCVRVSEETPPQHRVSYRRTLRVKAPQDTLLYRPPLDNRKVTEDRDRLDPKTRFLPLMGRDAEKQALIDWLETPAKRVHGQDISIRVLTGGAGVGKTRLAVELYHHAATVSEGDRWDAGFLRSRRAAKFFADDSALADWEWQQPTLMIIDYAAEHASGLNRLFQALIERPPAPRYPLRILLLERVADLGRGWWNTAFGGGDDERHNLLDPPQPVPVPPLPIGDNSTIRLQLFLAMRTACDGKPVPEEEMARIETRLGQVQWGGDPLFIKMAGLLSVAHGTAGILSLGRIDLAWTMAGREERRIRRIAPQAGLDQELLSHMAVCTTLCGGLDRADFIEAAHRERKALGYRGEDDEAVLTLWSALRQALPGTGESVGTILPDIIGEAFVLRALGPSGEDGNGTTPPPPSAEQTTHSTALFERTFQQRPGPVTAMAGRCIQDFIHIGHHLPLYWLSHLIQGENLTLELAMELANSLPKDSTTLVGMSEQVNRYIGDALRELGAGDGAHPQAALLAASLNNQSAMLSALGRRKEALTAVDEAVRIYGALSESRPEAFLPDLAMSLSNQSGELSALGRHKKALTAVDEAVRIRRALSEDRPETFLPDLAMSLNNQSNCLSALGRHEEALTAIDESVRIYGALSESRSDAFLPDLAMSLNNQSIRLSALGRHEEALTSIDESVRIRKELSEDRPEAFLPDLAGSLAIRSGCLSHFERHDEALTAIQEAVRTLSPFFLQHPRAHAQWMQAMVGTYLRCCQQMEEAPDHDLLTPIVELLQTLEPADESQGAEDDPEEV